MRAIPFCLFAFLSGLFASISSNFFHEIGGHPRPIQVLQPMHLSGSILNIFLASLMFRLNKTQDLLDITTEGPGRASSSFMTVLVSRMLYGSMTRMLSMPKAEANVSKFPTVDRPSQVWSRSALPHRVRGCLSYLLANSSMWKERPPGS